jgi:hypothetical protein
MSGLPPTSYSTSITTARYPVGTAPSTVAASDWSTGLVLQLGFHQQNGQPMPTPVITLDGQDVSNYVALSTNNADDLVVSLSAGATAPVFCATDSSLYLGASIVLSTFGDSFSGVVSATCADQDGTGVYLWTGNADTGNALTGIPIRADDGDLSVAELASLVPDDSVSSTAYSMVVENMKWAIAQSSDESAWLTDFFGETAPVLTSDQIALVNEDLTWYQQTFAKAYLSSALNSLTSPNGPSTTLSADQLARLQYFLQTTMAVDPSFVRQMSGVYMQAYVATQPRLEDYLDDGGSNWAASLLAAITTSDHLSNVVNLVVQRNEVDEVNNLATLLQLLDASGQSANTYVEAVLTAVLNNATTQTSVTDQTFTAGWLSLALETFGEQYADDEDASVSAAATEVANAAQSLGGYDALAGELATLLIAGGTGLIGQCESAAAAFAAKHADLAGAADALLVTAWAGSAVNVASAFSGGGSASPVVEAKMIVSGIKLVVKAVKAGINLLQTKIDLGDWNGFTDWLCGSDALSGSQDLLTQAGGSDWVRSGTTSIAELFDTESGEIETASTPWATIFDSAANVVAAIGVVASAASAVLSTLELINDIESGQPVSKDVTDGIAAVTSTAAAVCLVLELAMSAAVFGLAASVFAGVGLIVAIVALFLPAPASADPVNQFMTNVAIPFTESLPAPPAGSNS